ncbi:hypothetical protein [Ralstonia flaminis]|jgi:hypothetical protein|uniref:PLL-like beta propeller domain-containing protein n=1 Tax=Ralstonia flaminis TaxID=3058597 RepID=A0ABM9K316_9RALS|nr:hypothetical protein [Ralstonia sp. LMG 18101]CAJ0813273.1 hypothetical protein LMG18101_01849 [Ralstonia sp. LMG 18101]
MNKPFEFTEVDLSAVSLAATTDWANLGGAFRGTPQQIFYGGSMYVFTRNTDNTLGMCTVATSGDSGSWSKWGGTLQFNPSAAPSPNGTIAVIGLMQAGQVQVSYINPFIGSYTPWTTIGGGTPTTFTGAPVLAVNSNQRLEAFSLDTAGNLWHSYQTAVAPTITWSNWSKLGGGFNPQAQEFSVFLLQNSGQLQAVVLGKDNNLYQSTQYAGGGADSWSAFAVVGAGSNPMPQFVNGPAGNFCSNTNNATYAGCNSQSAQGQNPLVFCAPSSNPSYNFPTWGGVGNLTADQYPMLSVAPLIVSNAGTPQLVWMTNSRQVLLVSQSLASPTFWMNNVQSVGNANPRFTGLINAVISNGAVSLAQANADGTLSYINYLPQ